MWILSFLPDWVFHAIAIAGILGTIVGFALGMIPGIKTYVIPIRVISLLLLSFGLFLEGGLADYAVWEAKVKEVEAKMAEAEAQSAKANTKIVEKVVTKTQIVRTRGDDVIKYVDREIIKYDTKFAPGGECEIPKEFIKAHNDAAEAVK
jgi:flagellar biosynthesis component FlhA